MKILFMGDSITDAGKNDRCGCAVLGQGYAGMIAGRLLLDYPGKFTILNHGISAHRVTDLYARVERDIWNHAPDVLSVLIGINGVWRSIASGCDVDALRYERVLTAMISETKERYPDIKVILMEPFVLQGPATNDKWDVFSSETNLRAQAVRRVAEACGAIFLPLQKLLDKACEIMPATYWLPDGVHPSPAGHQLIADAWLTAFNKQILK